MSLHLLLNFFISGLILGSSSCALSCGWLLFPFISEKKASIKKSFFKFLSFHIGKIVSYVILGGLVGYSSQFITKLTNSKFLWLGGGVLFFIMGLLNLILPESRRISIKKNFVGVAGFIVGILPCGPLVGFLVYLAYVANNAIGGAVAGLAFGIGNTFNPLIILIFLIPAGTSLFERIIRNEKIYRIAGSMVFFWWATTLIWEATK